MERLRKRGVLWQSKLEGNYLKLFLNDRLCGLFVLGQQEVSTLTKLSSAGPVLNTFSCRNLTVQQAN